MIILDTEIEHEYSDEFIVSLSGSAMNSDIYIAQYIDENAEKYKSRYIDFISELGQARIKGKRIIDHLEIEDNISYWWLTLIAEQNPWKSPAIIDVLKIFALEDIISTENPESLVYVGANKKFFESVADLCFFKKVDCQWVKVPGNNYSTTRVGRNIKIPHIVHALFYLVKQIFLNLKVRRPVLDNSKLNDSSILICNYLDEINKKECVERGFRSPYWGRINALLKNKSITTNWLHIHVPSETFPTPGSTQKFLDVLNKKQDSNEKHNLVTAYLDLKIVIRVIRKYIRLVRKSVQLKNMTYHCKPSGENYSLFPILSNDWYSSLTGAAAINSLLFFELFNRVIESVEHQEKGLYLMENQAWERAFLFAWKKHQHGKVVGVQHSMIRFWDLRYFNSSKSLEQETRNPMPRPDVLAVNGNLAEQALLKWGYPQEELVETEALRYEFLGQQPKHPKHNDEPPVHPRVLILGDYVEHTMDKMMAMFLDVPETLRCQLDVVIKPHPNFQFSNNRYKGIVASIINQPLGIIVNDFDIAVTSNLTSASVDALLAGVQVIIFSEKDQLNFSPLKSQPGATFVYSAVEMATAISTAWMNPCHETPAVTNFFFFDNQLSRWASLLES
jgi:surface carbohydrate biosynthesis protein (TIGR04326 family)